MKIGIDISSVIYNTGVSCYTKNLVKSLLVEKGEEYVLFGGSLRRYKELKEFVSGLGGSKNYSFKFYHLPPLALELIWNKLHIFPVEYLIGKVDVFHSSDWSQPPSKALKVTTVHDLVPLRFPGLTHLKIVEAHKRRLGWVKKEVDKIIAVSEFTKKELVELLGILPEKITVIPEAADPEIGKVTDKDIEKVKKKFNITGKFLLAIGADSRKNIPNLISAFSEVDRNFDVQNLVVVGKQREKEKNSPGIIFTGHISRQNLCALYSGAEGLAYVSSYEGFGLPILEAMQVGCPVVTSNISSMPEVAGEAAVLVDPKDPEAIKKGIEKVLSNKQKWIDAGQKRAKEFSWEKTAKMTLQVYKDLFN